MHSLLLDSCVAFARLIGYLRHWYPAESTANTPWEDVAVQGYEQILRIHDRADLVRILEQTVATYAPLARVLDGTDDVAPVIETLRHPPTPAHEWITRWEHCGWWEGHSTPIEFVPVYSNRLRTESASTVQAERRPDASVYVGELHDALRIALPLSLWSDRSDPEYRWLPPTDRNLDRYDIAAPATRLAAVALGWNVIQHFAPEMERATENWHDVLRRTLDRSVDDGDEYAFGRTLLRMLAPLRDAHGSVKTPTEETLYRIPIRQEWVGDQLVVAWVDDGVPLQPGDVIVTVGGQPILDLLEQRRPELCAGTEDKLRRIFGHACLISRNQEPMALEVLRGDAQLCVKVTPVEMLESKKRLAGRLDPVTQFDDGVWYVDIWRCERDQIVAIGEQLAAAPGIIFDLRIYPSSFEVLSHISDTELVSPWWLEPTPTLPDRVDMTYKEENWTTTPEPPRYSRNVAFLTGPIAGSAAETLMGIIEGNRVAPVFGDHTGGTNGNIIRVYLPGGVSIVFTGMKVLKQDRSVHNGVGVLPTHRVLPTREGLAAGRDEVLEAALEYVRARATVAPKLIE